MSNQDNGGLSPMQRTMMILSLIMSVVYLCLSAYVFFRGDQFSGLPVEFTKIFAAILLMYGLFRAWKTYSLYFQKNRHDNF